MAERAECCGWASWGELVGIGDGRTRVEAWEREDAVVADPESVSASQGDSPNFITIDISNRCQYAVHD